MRLGSFTKTPAERKRYAIDYSHWLDTGETLQNVVFKVTPSTGATPMVVDAVSTNAANTVVIFFVNYGMLNVQYTDDVKATTSGGQIKEDTVIFTVKAAS